MKTPRSRQAIPFDFVLEQIASLNPHTKAMFGCTAVYVGLKIVFILRDRTDHLDCNGVWIATSTEHHESLRKAFPSMRSLSIFGSEPTNWQLLPTDAHDFEPCVLRACELVIAKDPRIGKIPSSKSSRSKKKK